MAHKQTVNSEIILEKPFFYFGKIQKYKYTLNKAHKCNIKKKLLNYKFRIHLKLYKK